MGFLRTIGARAGAGIFFVAAAFAIYGQALNNAFVLDDETQIVENPAIRDWRNIPLLFLSSTNKQSGSDRLAGVYYKPLMTAAYAAIWGIDGPNAAVFHGFQIAMHALNAWLVFLFLSRIGRKPPAFILALAFLAHPLNSEVAIYSADLQDALYVAFGLGALLVVSSPKPFGGKRTVVLCALLLASLLSKESGVLFWLASGAWFWLHRRAELRAATAALAVAAAAYASLRFGGAKLWDPVGISWAQIGQARLAERLLSIPRILFHYARVFAWPDRLIVAQDWVVRTVSWEQFWGPLAAVSALAAVVAGSCARLRRGGLFFGFLLTMGLSLHCQLAPLDGTVADRWFIVPMIALLGLAALGWERGASSMRLLGGGENLVRGSSLAALALALAVIVGWAARSRERVEDWKDGYTLYARDLLLDPENGLLQNNLGTELFRMGDHAAALERFRRATQLSPHWTIPWNNLGAALEAFGRWEEAEAAYRASLERGVYDLAVENYPRLLLKRGRRAEALSFIDGVGLRLLPTNPTLLSLKAMASAN